MWIMKAIKYALIGLGSFGFLYLLMYGSFLNAQMQHETQSSLKANGFKIEEANSRNIIDSWSSPRKQYLCFNDFVLKAKELAITTIYLEYSESGYGYDYWFFKDNVKYLLT